MKSPVVTIEASACPCGIVTRGDLLQPDSGVAQLLDGCRCSCCGLTRHLRTGSRGQVLCIYCHERATDGSWLELGEGD